MKSAAYCLFETPLGWCGMAWSETSNPDAPHAINLFMLPEANANLTENKIAKIWGRVAYPLWIFRKSSLLSPIEQTCIWRDNRRIS